MPFVRFARAAVVLQCLWSPASAVYAGKYVKPLDVGDTVPSWGKLQGADGKNHTLEQYKAASWLVVVFVGNDCPISQQYDQRLIELQSDFENENVQFVVIATTTHKMKLEEIAVLRARAKKAGFNFPYLHDPFQQTAGRFGVQRTTTSFLLDKNRDIVFMGSIDDDPDLKDPPGKRKSFLKQALSEATAGKPISEPEPRIIGCGIYYADPQIKQFVNGK